MHAKSKIIAMLAIFLIHFKFELKASLNQNNPVYDPSFELE